MCSPGRLEDSLTPAKKSEVPLFDHQREGVDFLRAHPRAALFDEPGLGKTRQLLLAATPPILVVAPAMILESGVWDDEIEAVGYDGEVAQVSYTRLTEKGPRGRIDRDGNGFPTNPPRSEYRRRWGTKIADESHYLKGRKTNWTGAFLQLQADHTDLSTGTPIQNWAQEAFTQLQALYPEKAKPGRELGSYWRWVKEWFQVGSSVWAQLVVGDLRPDRTWDDFVRENWGDRMILRRRDECLDLPPLTVQSWRVQMTKEQRRVYRKLEEDFVAWLESGETIAAWSSASQLVKLAKAATGLEILSRGAGESAKLAALEEILTSRPRQTLVVAHFQETVWACARSAARVGKEAAVVHGGIPSRERKLAVRAFQRGELDVLCASIGTISEGLTLHQGGADQVIRVERSYLPSRNDQVLRRLHRIGQKNPVLAIDLVTSASCDVAQLALLAGKTDQQMKALGQRDLRRLAAGLSNSGSRVGR